MRLRKLLEDDDAVSPVIGVILMVAITVILAAVIASFVLGLGNQAGTVAPTASFGFDYSTNGSSPGHYLEITHDNGEAIPEDLLYIRGDNLNGNTGQWAGDANGRVEGETAVQAGDSWEIGVDNAKYEISVVWESASGDTTSTLAEDSGPQA